MLTSQPRSFQQAGVVETRLSEFQWITVSVMKMSFIKLPPKLLDYQDYRNFDNSQFMKLLHSALSREETEILEKYPDVFFKIRNGKIVWKQGPYC